MPALKRDSATNDYGPIIGPHDPLVIKLGLVKNPVLVKDIRLLARHIWNLKPHVRITYAVLMLLPWVVFLCSIAIGLDNVGEDLYCFMPYVNNIVVSTLIDYFYAFLVVFLRDQMTIFYSALLFTTIIWCLLALPSNYLFYGFDNSEDRFSAIRISSISIRTILQSKLFLQIPVFLILFISTLIVLYNCVNNARGFGYWTGQNDSSIISDPYLVIDGIIVVISFSILWILFSFFLLTLGKPLVVRIIVIVLVFTLLIGFNVITFGLSEYFACDSDFSISGVLAMSVTPLDALKLFVDGRPEYEFGIYNTRALPLYRDDMLIYYKKLHFTVFFQFFWAALSLYGIHWNVKRRLENWHVKGRNDKVLDI